MRRFIALSPLLVFVAGCSNLASDASTGGPMASPCSQAKIDECAVGQRACNGDASGGTCVACADGSFADKGACSPLKGTAMTHDFATFTTKPGEEVLGLCQSWTINNPEEIWVNAVELSQDEASHHSNWTFVPDDKFDGPDGVWKCDDRNYSQLTAALFGGVLYAQSTQASHEVQKFPNGAAVRIAPYSRIVGDIHLLNTTQAAITGHAKLGLYTLAKADVGVKLVPFHLDYLGLDIPAQAKSRFTGACDLNKDFQAQTSKPFAMKLYYALPHTHKMASRFFFQELDGTPILDVGGFNGDARGRAFDPPLDLDGKNGLAFGCEYNNTRAENVKWGFGDQEMCELLGFADAEVAFESDIDVATPAGKDGDRQLFTGPCKTAAFKWSNDRPGGPGPKNQ